MEDEAFVREVAGEILWSAGYPVLPARNAAEAIQAFRNHPEEVQLLLTDVVLPDRNGRDLALELVAVRPGVKATLYLDIRKIPSPERVFSIPDGLTCRNHFPPGLCSKK